MKQNVARTIESSNNGFPVNPLLHHDLDMGICACDRLETVDEEVAGVVGRGPGIAELKDELPYGWQICSMAVCWL